jgi:hypothetical protein
MQAAGLKSGFIVNERELKEKYLVCALPATPLFNGTSIEERSTCGIPPYLDAAKEAQEKELFTETVWKRVSDPVQSKQFPT